MSPTLRNQTADLIYLKIFIFWCWTFLKHSISCKRPTEVTSCWRRSWGESTSRRSGCERSGEVKTKRGKRWGRCRRRSSRRRESEGILRITTFRWSPRCWKGGREKKKFDILELLIWLKLLKVVYVNIF